MTAFQFSAIPTWLLGFVLHECPRYPRHFLPTSSPCCLCQREQGHSTSLQGAAAQIASAFPVQTSRNNSFFLYHFHIFLYTPSTLNPKPDC